MGILKPLVKTGVEAAGRGLREVLPDLFEGATEAGVKALDSVPQRDWFGLSYLKRARPDMYNQYKQFANNGQLPVMAGLADYGVEYGMKESHHAQELAIRNTTTGIPAADKQAAEQLASSPEGTKWFEQRQARKEEIDARILDHKARGKKGFSREDPELFAHKGRLDKAIAGDVRTGSDNLSTAKAEFISDQLSDPLRAEAGYGKSAGQRNPQRDPKKGFKPSNKDLETGRTYQEYLEQHHLLFNREGSALFQQQIFKEDPSFVIAAQRYLAKKYDAAFGEAAQNMANVPSDQVHAPYHKWLRELKLDGVSGKNYEQFWKQKLLENDKMTAQQIQDALDEWFEEIIYPSIIVLDDYMSKADLSTVNVKDIAFPENLLKQARASIENELNPVKPTIPRGKGTTTTHDVQMDDIQTRAERGEFGPGRRSWFKDSKARGKAKEIVQQGG